MKCIPTQLGLEFVLPNLLLVNFEAITIWFNGKVNGTCFYFYFYFSITLKWIYDWAEWGLCNLKSGFCNFILIHYVGFISKIFSADSNNLWMYIIQFWFVAFWRPNSCHSTFVMTHWAGWYHWFFFFFPVSISMYNGSHFIELHDCYWFGDEVIIFYKLQHRVWCDTHRW